MEEALRAARYPDLVLRFALIEQAPLFRGVARAELSLLAERARDRRVRRGQTLFQEGEPAGEIGVLGTGRVKLTQLSASGEEIILRLVGAGELLGGLGVPRGGASTTTAQAMEASHALLWERRGFEEVMERIPALHRNALRIMAERLRSLEDRYREVATERVPQRLAHALLRLIGQIGRPDSGGVLVALSREELAQMTGTTLFSVSRLLSQWESQGMVRARREAVIVDDTRALIAVAERQPVECPLPEERLPADCPVREASKA
ncbi:MAG TPA: Crp/Fnr family transcriptional regulator [Vicinamibacteria bacterium]|nr:Crp/Fnr family transcriptional regulator [Vicinamibacteria bacterium]